MKNLYSRFELFRMGFGFGVHFIPNVHFTVYPFPLRWWSVRRWAYPFRGKVRHNIKCGPFFLSIDGMDGKTVSIDALRMVGEEVE